MNRCLIIPDVHQDLVWLKALLKQTRNWDHCVFLGDYFDTRKNPSEVATMRETARFLIQLARKHPGKITFLWGNHDIPYLEAHRTWKQSRHRALPKTNAGVTISGLDVNGIFAEWPPDFVQNVGLFQVANGHLISHAGIASRFWPEASTNEESLAILQEECAIALRDFHQHYFPLLAPGIARGGEEPIGGITWQCWTEFEDSLPLPQIVGHTRSQRGARQTGRSWCLDGGQTCYGLLEGPTLTVKEIAR